MDTVYTRSTRGFSLWKSKVLSVGGSSLKWSKSIEKHSKQANEVSLTFDTLALFCWKFPFKLGIFYFKQYRSFLAIILTISHHHFRKQHLLLLL